MDAQAIKKSRSFFTDVVLRQMAPVRHMGRKNVVVFLVFLFGWTQCHVQFVVAQIFEEILANAAEVLVIAASDVHYKVMVHGMFFGRSTYPHLVILLLSSDQTVFLTSSAEHISQRVPLLTWV